MDSIPQKTIQSTFDFEALSLQPVPEVVLHVTHELIQDQNYWWSDLEYRTIPNSPGIYCIVNTKDQSFYVGSATGLKERKHHHFRDLRAENHKNTHLQRAYNRDGMKSFRFCILEHVKHVENLLEREQHFIDTLDPHYNIARTAGSNLGMTYSDESKAKLSAARRAYPGLADDLAKATEAARIANTGRKQTPEQLENRRGRKHTPNSIERMSIAQRERERTPEEIERLNVGRVHTLESRENMGAPKRGRKQSPEHVEKRAVARRGKKQSPEHAAKSRVAFLGGEHTPESKAKMSASRKGKKQSPEHVAKRTAGQRGKKANPEHQAKATEAARIANTGRKQSPATIAKREATKRAKREAKLLEQQNQPPLF